ncbi:hypothetical protein [Streptomyces sp. B6B3]|uniref:hypothetical protein n=1 Tax=Streptomyces sp. B6B3 TaxID=3153570 RepID=UPI00325EC9B0
MAEEINEDAGRGALPDWPVTRDGYWTLHWHIPRDRKGARYSVVVLKIRNDPPRTTILVRSEGQVAAKYQDARVGDVVEIADKRWEIAEIDTGRMDVSWKDRGFEAGSVRLKLLGPAASDATGGKEVA